MELIDARTYRAQRPWGAQDVAVLDSASIRLHWTDQPYHWHVNDDTEVFVVVDGRVNMHIRNAGVETVVPLMAGDVLRMDAGDEHYAEPVGEARILVVERCGSE